MKLLCELLHSMFEIWGPEDSGKIIYSFACPPQCVLSTDLQLSLNLYYKVPSVNGKSTKVKGVFKAKIYLIFKRHYVGNL